VEFSSPNEAKSAFSGTAYKNFKGRPMMLEMAPTGILAKTRPTPPKEVEAVAEASVDSNSAPENPVDQVFDVADTEEIEECSTLFVKNLSFETTNDQLSSLFRSFDGFRSASISTKADPRNAGKKLSMGFGFVEYRNKESAKKALEALNVS
jgi:multiple RNA-binding domain-containing protein 1